MNFSRFSAVACFISMLSTSSPIFAAGLPPIADSSGVQYPGTFVWFDLITPDRDKVRAYYEDIFGWTIAETAGYPGYDMITNQGLQIGGIAEIPEEKLPAWLGSLSVSDIDRAANRVTQLGGRLLEAVEEIEGRGSMALVEDNSGAAFVLLDTRSRDPEQRPVRIGDWLWVDLFVRDTKAPEKFYDGLLGMRLKTIKDKDGSDVNVFLTGDSSRSGVVRIPFKHVDPIWLPYVRVADIEQTIAHSAQLGGQLFFRFGDGAILLDPAGAAVGVQQVSKNEGQGQ